MTDTIFEYLNKIYEGSDKIAKRLLQLGATNEDIEAVFEKEENKVGYTFKPKSEKGEKIIRAYNILYSKEQEND